jgi:hypothetical protein
VRFIGLPLALYVVAGAGHAHADLVKDAETLAAGGDFVNAATRFREAYAAEPDRPELICNAGVAYFKANDLPRAHRYLTRCSEVGKALDADFMSNVEKVVASVEAALSAGPYTPVDITTTPATAVVAIAGAAPFDEPLGQGRVWFPQGSYNLVVSAPGFETERRTVAAEGAAAIQQSFVLHATATSPDRRWQGYVVGGVGLVALGVGVGFGLRARSLADEVRAECADSCEWNLVADKDEAGRRAQTLQFVMYGVGAVGVTTGVWLYLRGRPSKLAIAPREGGTMVTWSGGW